MTAGKNKLNMGRTACWIVLLCLMVPLFGSYFFDDMFSTLSHLFKNPEMLELGWDSADYGVYAGGYSFLCVCGGLVLCGILLDVFGVRIIGSVFVSLMILGAGLVCFAITAGFQPKVSLAVAYVGCMIFGLGSEITGVAVTRSIAKWFKGRRVALAMGLQISISRLGTAMAFILAPVLVIRETPGHVYTLAETSRPAFLGLILLLVGGILWSVFVMMDARFDVASGAKAAKGVPASGAAEASPASTSEASAGSSAVETPAVSAATETSAPAVKAPAVSSATETSAPAVKTPAVSAATETSAPAVKTPAPKAKGKVRDEDKFKFSDLGKVLTDPRFIMIALLCVFFYCCIISFKKFGTSIVIPRFGMDTETAKWMITMIPFFTIVFTPLFGSLVDKIGRATALMIVGSVLVLSAHLIIAFAPQGIAAFGYLAISLLGIGYSLVPSAMWPSVPKIIPEKNLGTAYSLIYWIQNMGMLLVPIAVGNVIKSTVTQAGNAAQEVQAAVYAEYIFVSLGILATAVALALWRSSRRHPELKLDLPAGK